MQSRMRYLIPLILAALIPLSSLAGTSAPANGGSARYALFFGKKKNKTKKQQKTPKSKRSHGAKKQHRAKSAR